MDHHCYGPLGIRFRIQVGVGKTADGTLGIVVTTLTDEPPGRLGDETGHEEEGYRPDPVDVSEHQYSYRILLMSRKGTDHWMAKGNLQLFITRDLDQFLFGSRIPNPTYPQSEMSPVVALTTPEESKIPAPQHRLT
jgi:hypothetical protein